MSDYGYTMGILQCNDDTSVVWMTHRVSGYRGGEGALIPATSTSISPASGQGHTLPCYTIIIPILASIACSAAVCNVRVAFCPPIP